MFRKRRRLWELGTFLEALEERVVPADLVHVSGDLTGNAQYAISAPFGDGGPLDNYGGSYTMVNLMHPEEGAADPTETFIAGTGAPPLYLPSPDDFPNIPSSYVEGFLYNGGATNGLGYFETIDAHADNSQDFQFDSSSTSFKLGDLLAPTPITYQFVPTQSFEHVGDLLHIHMTMDAVFAALIFEPAAETPDDATLDYTVTYTINSTAALPVNETIFGRANTVTPGTDYDRATRDIPLDVHIGDTITLAVALQGTLSPATAVLRTGRGALVGSTINFGITIGEDPPPTPQVQIGVSAQYNELDSETPARAVPRDIQVSSDEFGPYLPGVNLDNKFTVNLTGTGVNDINQVTWSLGDRSGTAQKTSQGTWTFTINMGQVAAQSSGVSDETQTLIVRALDSDQNDVEEYQGKVVYRHKLNFELQVSPSGQDNDLLDVEKARFFNGIQNFMSFTGTVDGMAGFYQSKFALVFGATNQSVSWEAPDHPGAQKFTINYNVGGLAVGTTQVDARLGSLPITVFHDQLEPLLAEPLPTWLANSTHGYDPLTKAYDFDNAKPALIDERASLAKTGEKWLDAILSKVDSFVNLQAILNISAPLDVNQTVDYHASELDTAAQILGKTIWDKHYTSDNLNFGGTLDPKTLDPNSFGVTLKEPLPLANTTFFDQTLKIDLVKKLAPALPKWLLDVELSFALKVIGNLQVTGGILLSKVGSSIQYVASNSNGSMGTFITLTAAPHADFAFGAHFEVGKKYIAAGDATVSGVATLTIVASARFAGTVLSPTIQSASLSAKLDIKYRVVAQAGVLGSTDDVKYDSAAPENGGPDDDVLGPYELLQLTLSKAGHHKK